MGGEWTMLSISKYFGARHKELMDAKIKRYRAQARDSRFDQEARITQLEDDFARALLVIHSLAETCIAKGVFTPAELMEITARVDLEDGPADGKLDPQTIRPEAEEDGPPATTESYLRDLEQQADHQPASDSSTNLGEINSED